MGKMWENLSDAELYDLMCDNREPERKYWYFTFGSGQRYAGKCVKIRANNSAEARKIMVGKYGTKWAFQYTEREWLAMENDPQRTWPMEQLMETIE